MKNLTPLPESRTTVIRGSGFHVPSRVVTNEMMSRIMETSDDWIVPRTGIRERRFAEPGVGSAELGFLAAREALADAGLTIDDVDFIVFATMTPDLYFPGNGGLLARQLGMKTTHALDIRMQCVGFLSGLQTADAFIRSGMYDRILLVGAEVHSGLMPWPQRVWDVMLGRSTGPCDPEWYEKVTRLRDRAVLFGDGAGAFVLEAHTSGDGRGLLSFAMFTDGNHWDKLHVPGVGCRFRPYVSHEMVDRLESVPIVEGRHVFRLAAQLMPAAVRQVLEANGRSLADVDLVLMHQANLRINEAAQKALGLPDEKVFNNIEKYGNTTAATLPIAFHEAKRAGRIKRGSVVVFTALGAGLHWGAGLAVV